MATSNGMFALPAAVRPHEEDPAAAPTAQATPQAMPQQAAAPDARAGMLSDWYDSYMSTTPKTTAATAAQAGTTEWKPGADSTVQGQLTGILDKGGPLMDRAATKAAQVMNGRGLLNSSMAVTAGQSALYDAAMPIAQQDATTNAAAGQFNANASNTAALTNAGLTTDVSKVNAGAENDATKAQSAAGVGSFQQQQGIAGQQALQTTDIANQNAMQAKDLASRYDLATMDVESRAALQAADAANQQKLQAANAALQTGLQATDNAVKQSMQQYQLGVQQAMQGLDNENKLKIATLDANTQTNLADLERQYRVQMQTSQSMAASYQSLVDSATRTMLDPSLDADGKAAVIGNLVTLYNNTLKMQSELTGLNLGELLSPDAFGAVPSGTDSTSTTTGPTGPVTKGPSPDANDPSWVYDDANGWVRIGDYGAGGG